MSRTSRSAPSAEITHPILSDDTAATLNFACAIHDSQNLA
jgi:hypothetical protein